MQAQSWWYVSDLIRSSCIPQSLSGRVTTALCSITTQVLYRFTYTGLDQIRTFFSPLFLLFLGLNYDINFFCSSSPSLFATPSPSGNPILLLLLLFFSLFFNAERDIQDDTTLFFFTFFGLKCQKEFSRGRSFFMCILIFPRTANIHHFLSYSLSLSVRVCCCLLWVGKSTKPPTNKPGSPLVVSKDAGGVYFYINI